MSIFSAMKTHYLQSPGPSESLVENRDSKYMLWYPDAFEPAAEGDMQMD
jgi:hypothetical protein